VQAQVNDKNLVEQGFTLIELLVVIAILGVLAGVVVFAVGGITDRGKNSACLTEVRTIRTAIEAYYAKTGDYPAAAASNSAADTATALNVMATGADKFLDGPVGTVNPSIAAGYRYSAAPPLGVYDGGTCPT
jgi:prepilin-type N-terminal cleavage/methylation domain-containing protein